MDCRVSLAALKLISIGARWTNDSQLDLLQPSFVRVPAYRFPRQCRQSRHRPRWGSCRGRRRRRASGNPTHCSQARREYLCEYPGILGIIGVLSPESRHFMNPLLDFSGLPRFDAIKAEHVTPAIDVLLEENRRVVEAM